MPMPFLREDTRLKLGIGNTNVESATVPDARNIERRRLGWSITPLVHPLDTLPDLAWQPKRYAEILVLALSLRAAAPPSEPGASRHQAALILTKNSSHFLFSEGSNWFASHISFSDSFRHTQ